MHQGGIIMDNKNMKIIVTGDICMNLLMWKTHAKSNNTLNWEHYPNVHSTYKTGEALLLSELVAIATGAAILSPRIEDIEVCLPKGILSSTSELKLFPVTSDEKESNKVYREKKFFGFSGPTSGSPLLLPIINDDENADMIILDDEDNGFNSREEFWPLAIKSHKKTPIVIYKMNNPSSSNNLLNRLSEFNSENTIVVINADNLRAKGVNISKSLSWERTALDFIWQMNNNPNINFLSKCHHVIVHFGLEGAIYYKNKGDTAESQLFFLTSEFEGDFINENQGEMYGLTDCFVAGISRGISSGKYNNENLSKLIAEGIREGIVATQKYFINGFGENIDTNIFPSPSIFIEGEKDFIYKENIQDVPVRNSNNPDCRSCWYIIKDNNSNNLAEIAYNIVVYGEKSALKVIPIAQFGNLKTVDRTEIEAYRSIKNLMCEYISGENIVRPLSIAVFGTPGSGKSFGVTEVASSIAPNLIRKSDFNLSEFQTQSDLIAAFHKVRDISLEGKLPLVFFDEFDSTLQGKKLGWLKYFLAPMQDGVFRSGDSVHPIGKAIFVFAGGTSTTFKDFCGENLSEGIEHKQFLNEFESTKGPDFVSRLRGYVNILGPNQTDQRWDQLFIVRRAMLLRSLLERKTPHLINKRGEAQIDNGVLRALLKVPKYKHESRSMEAIIEMSMINKAKKWEQYQLPSKEQLKLHVDEEQFSRHLMHDAFFSEKIDKIAMTLHYNHMILNEECHKANVSYRKSWEELSEEMKDSTRDQVRHIPSALHKVNFELISDKEKPEAIIFTKKEMDILAEYEHKRWSLEKKEAGWEYGATFDEEKKTQPLLVSFDSLPIHSKNNIIENVKSWPEILANSYFKIERLKYLCYCETHLLV